MSTELLPCPFCGGGMRINSNRDWHHLIGDHDNDCPFDADDDTMCVPASTKDLAWMVAAWNRRAPVAAPSIPSGKAVP